MDNPKVFFSKSFVISVILHVIFFAMLLITFVSHTEKKTVMVNLQQDLNAEPKIVKAALIDRRDVEREIQRQADIEQQQKEKVLAEQRRVEQLKHEAELAKQAAVLAQEKKFQAEIEAKKVAQAKQKLEQQQLQLRKQLAQQEAQAKALREKQAQEARADLAKKRAAAKQADLLRAQQAAAEHQEFVLSEVEKYRIAIQSSIEENRILSSVFTGNIVCKIQIKLLPDGSILSANILQSSGNKAYDEMSTTAVHKSAPFPMPQDHELYSQLKDIVLSFKNGAQSADES